MDELKTVLENKLSAKSTNEWISQMEKDKIPCGPISVSYTHLTLPTKA